MKKIFISSSILALLGLIFLYISGDFIFTKAEIPEGLILANGRIEGDTATVATKIAGRIMELYFNEGDEVDKGFLLARIESKELEARKRGYEAAVKEAKARYEVSLSLLEKAKARFDKSLKDIKRYRILHEKELIPLSLLEEINLSYKAAEAELNAARKQVEAARNNVDRNRAGLNEIKALIEDTYIRSPISGTVTTRIAEPGEMLAAGGPIAEIVNLDKLYLKVYVPEKMIAKVRLGIKARIYTDSYPENPIPATVKYISSRAEFTPKEVQTPDERVKLVYPVKLYLDENPDHRFTPGMPADGLIRWKEGTKWVKPVW